MSEGLRTFLQSDHSRSDKALALLSTMGRPSSVSEMSALAADNGLRIPTSWNLSTSLARAGKLAIRTTAGWELTEAGRDKVGEWGFSLRTKAVVDSLTNLRSQVGRLASTDTARFLIETIECVEHGYHRAAAIMSWVAAVHVLQAEVLRAHLAAFNAEVAKRDSKWRPAKTVDDMGRLKEAEFLDVLVAISMLGKNVKNELQNCLDRRNACGHPNSYDLQELTVAHHIETLVTNVFSKF